MIGDFSNTALSKINTYLEHKKRKEHQRCVNLLEVILCLVATNNKLLKNHRNNDEKPSFVR